MVICCGIEPQVHYTQHAGEYIDVHLPPQAECQNRHVTITEGPSTSNGSSASSDGMLMTDVGPFSTDSSPCRIQVISTNLDGGHGGLWWDCSSIFSQEEAAGMSVSSVVMGWSLPWTIDRDHLGKAQ